MTEASDRDRELLDNAEMVAYGHCGDVHGLAFNLFRTEALKAIAIARAEGVVQGQREALAPTWSVVTRAEYKALPFREEWRVPDDRDARRVVLWNYQTGEPVAVLDIPTLRALA